MSFSTIIQRHACSSAVIRRHVSTKAAKRPNPKSHRTLPDAKMRALIALYHQADNFITPENLSQRIDEAFVSDTVESKLAFSRSNNPLKDLKNALADQRRAPKIAEWDSESLMRTYHTNGVTWSTLRTARELKVVEALYGVNATRVGDALPGLEVLEDSMKSKSRPRGTSDQDMKDILQDSENQP
ncbi:hypothetical protein Hypma_009586 [Hypsizygus marmoreus]|uniref:Uncharacterized protein n=1 Tax=Hypsizygus marmoreus TaxID=39966 RepID=A0A369JPF4_HYPMA|nr:hypothetical protein Hypma_009586 [Hypsizygus marmoreus]